MPQEKRYETYDVIVIGAGVVGCCTARELARWKLKVLVLEAGLDIACGATRANSGIVHAGYDPKPGTLKAQYNVRGAALYPQWQRELGFAYYKNGALVVAFNDSELQTLHKLLARAEQNGVARCRIISADELRELEPQVSPEAIGALEVPESGVCDPYGLAYGAAENAANNGVEFLFDHGVTALKRTDVEFEITAAGETFKTRCIVNAAGIHSDEMNNLVSERKLRIQPKRGEYHLFKNTLHVFQHTMFQAPTAAGKGVLATPVVFGNLILGPNSEPQESKADVSTTQEGLADVLQKAKRTWPGANVDEVISTFAGLRACNASGDDFVIGEAEDAPGFFNAACIDSPGLASAPAIAQDLAQQVAAKLGAAENASFDPVRVPAPLLVIMDEASRNELIAANPAYGKPVCRCCHVSEGELVDALHRSIPVLSLDALKWRTGATMGPCQGGRCTAKILKLMMRELGVDAASVCKRMQGSPLVFPATREALPEDAFIEDDETFEQTRASYEVPGARPAGVYSAHLVHNLLTLPNCLPGTRAVIWGDTEAAKACAAELEQAGVEVVATLLPDETVTHIKGANRVESVTVAAADGAERVLACDLLVISREMVADES